MDTCIILQVVLYSWEEHRSKCCMIRSYFRQVTLSVHFLLLLMESRLRIEGRELRIEYSFIRKVVGVPTKF
ncbi:hypothetical protein RIF29_15484 [Crotalaria pallida]|uniref:Uncharacterized protein n=1 Tax=Crotalaria pallida TaxID=3830 RepID=A0AAN9FF63_CROPI